MGEASEVRLPLAPAALATQHNTRSLDKWHQHLHMYYSQPRLPRPLNFRPCSGKIAYKSIRLRLHFGLQLSQLSTLQQNFLTLLETMRQARHNPIIILFRSSILRFQCLGHLSAGMLKQTDKLLR